MAPSKWNSSYLLVRWILLNSKNLKPYPSVLDFWKIELETFFQKSSGQTWFLDSFHLCLFNFPLIYQFHSIMTTLVRTTCWNPAELIIWKSFHHHFKRIWRGLLIKIEMQLLLLSLLKYSEMLSQMITFYHFRCHLSYFSSYK